MDIKQTLANIANILHSTLSEAEIRKLEQKLQKNPQLLKTALKWI